MMASSHHCVVAARSTPVSARTAKARRPVVTSAKGLAHGQNCFTCIRCAANSIGNRSTPRKCGGMAMPTLPAAILPVLAADAPPFSRPGVDTPRCWWPTQSQYRVDARSPPRCGSWGRRNANRSIANTACSIGPSGPAWTVSPALRAGPPGPAPGSDPAGGARFRDRWPPARRSDAAAPCRRPTGRSEPAGPSRPIRLGRATGACLLLELPRLRSLPG